MLDPKEIAIEIARLEYEESSYPAYAKLAALYIIRNQMNQEEQVVPSARYSTAPSQETMPYYGNSEFLEAISNKDQAKVMAVIDDLMDTLSVTNPRVYKGVMRRICDL